MPLTIKTWNIESMTGYKPKTTFYEDFSIADNFGLRAIKDTFETAFKYYKNDVEYLTELIMVLNWKSWEHSNGDTQKMNLYISLYYKANDYAYNNLKGEDLKYFIRTTD